MSSAARTLPRRVLDHIRSSRLWLPGQSIIVSVSGGVDSMVLLHVLHRTQGAHGGNLRVVTMDHGLRSDSEDEVQAVAAASEGLGLPCDVVKLSLETGPNLAERARDARRAVLKGFDADCIATGHHEGDQAETVLYNLLRGSGSRGLRGMQPKNQSWVRPLLRESKLVIEAWARMESIVWFEDPSNPTSQRGRIRELMPELDKIQGGAGRAMARSARLLAREDGYFSDYLDECWLDLTVDNCLVWAKFDVLHPAIQLRALRRLIADGRVRAEPLEAIMDGALREQGQLDLGYGLRFASDGIQLWVERI